MEARHMDHAHTVRRRDAAVDHPSASDPETDAAPHVAGLVGGPWGARPEGDALDPLDDLGHRYLRLQAIVRSAGIGTWEWNVQTGETIFDRRWAEIVGYELDDLEPLSIDTWLRLVHPEDREVSRRALEAHFGGAVPFYDVECRMCHRDGHWVWIRDRGRVVSRTPDGEPEWMFGTHSDISHLKAVEEDLRRSNLLLSQSERIANLGTWHLDLDKDGLKWSDQVFRIFGIEPDALTPTFDGFLQHVHPRDRERVEAAYTTSLLSRADGYEVQHRIVRADTGEVRHVHERCVHERDTAGRIVRSTGTVHDITDQVLREDEVRRSEADYRSLTENSRDVIVRFDPRGRHIYANAAAAAMSGIPAEEHVGRTPREIGLPEALAAVVDQVIETVTASREPLQLQVELLGRHLDSQCVPEFGDGGAVASVLCIFRDITEVVVAAAERSEMERRVLHAQKLESLGVLAGGIAHDFNNILTTLLGNVEMALEDLPATHPATASLQAAVSGVHKATGLTGQMLDYSGRGAVTTERVDVAGLTRDLLDLLRSSVPRSIELRVEGRHASAPVDGSAPQLQQVLMNLVTNAADAIGDGPGTIEVRLATTRAPAPPAPGFRVLVEPATATGQGADSGWAVLSVCDDGCGMDAEVQERIFEPFFTTKFQGRGLGMAAVLGIVQGHRGGLFLKSEPGAGSTFTVLLPLAEGVAAPPPVERPRGEPVAAGATLSGARVLVVDDEPAVCRPLVVALRRRGAEVRTAGDGVEALARLDEGPADLVFLDLTMPRMGGVACFDELRRRAPGLPVVVMSGYSAGGLERRFAGPGPEGVLQKPFSPRDAVGIAEELLGRASGPVPDVERAS